MFSLLMIGPTKNSKSISYDTDNLVVTYSNLIYIQTLGWIKFQISIHIQFKLNLN